MHDRLARPDAHQPPASGAPGAGWLAFCRHRIAQLTGQSTQPADA